MTNRSSFFNITFFSYLNFFKTTDFDLFNQNTAFLFYKFYNKKSYQNLKSKTLVNWRNRFRRQKPNWMFRKFLKRVFFFSKKNLINFYKKQKPRIIYSNFLYRMERRGFYKRMLKTQSKQSRKTFTNYQRYFFLKSIQNTFYPKQTKWFKNRMRKKDKKRFFLQSKQTNKKITNFHFINSVRRHDKKKSLILQKPNKRGRK